MSLPQIYLASSSPRRAELLRQLGVDYEVLSQDVPEQGLPNESPEAFVQRLALAKARAGWEQLAADRCRPVLGADTVVVIGDMVLGKPEGREHAMAMLANLSGKAHRVLSAVAVVGQDDLGQDKAQVCCNESQVWFRELSVAECSAYWDSGEPADKAGSYAIQGLAALFIERLEGSYSGVMGLPLFETGELLQTFGINIMSAE